MAGLGGDAWGEIEEVFLTLSVDPELSDDAFDDLPDQVVTVELKD